MSSNGSANELLASLMPLSPGGWIGENFERDWQMENGDVYRVTAVPGSEWQVYDNDQPGAKGAPATFTVEVEDNVLNIIAAATEDGSIEEPTDDQHCGVEVNLIKPGPFGIKKVTLSAAIGDSDAQLSALQMEYAEGGTNETTVQLTGTVDRNKVYKINVTPLGKSWCTIVAEGESKTSGGAGYSVNKSWSGEFVPDEIVIKGSADQAGTQDVFTLTIKVNSQS